jgi:conjugal transfer pilus assembly protein TraE
MDIIRLKDELAARTGLKQSFFIILAISLVLNVIFGLANYSLSSRSIRTILVPPEIDRAFWVDGTNIDPTHMEQMATYVVNLYTTFTPHNIGYNSDILLKQVDAKAYKDLAVRFKQREVKVRKQALSQVFYPNEIRIDEKTHTAVVFGSLSQFIVDKALGKATVHAFLVRFGNSNGYMSITALREVDGRDPFADVTDEVLQEDQNQQYQDTVGLEGGVEASVLDPDLPPQPQPLSPDEQQATLEAIRSGEIYIEPTIVEP